MPHSVSSVETIALSSTHRWRPKPGLRSNRAHEDRTTETGRLEPVSRKGERPQMPREPGQRSPHALSRQARGAPEAVGSRQDFPPDNRQNQRGSGGVLHPWPQRLQGSDRRVAEETHAPNPSPCLPEHRPRDAPATTPVQAVAPRHAWRALAPPYAVGSRTVRFARPSAQGYSEFVPSASYHPAAIGGPPGARLVDERPQ